VTTGAQSASAAFFDLDRTLMAGSSGFHWARAAYRAGLLSRRRLAADAWENIKFRLRGSTDAATDAVRERVSNMIAGQRVVDLGRLAPQVLAGVLPRLYPQMLRVAYEHQDAGRPVYICTAASQEMADLMAHVLQFDGAVGSRSEVVDGRYTGRPAGPFAYREGKAQLMRELAAEQGVDLAASWAYSDSESDLPMLRAVGRPVAVGLAVGIPAAFGGSRLMLSMLYALSGVDPLSMIIAITLMLMVATLGFTLLGEAMRDVADPKIVRIRRFRRT